ncbi:hypothetical protein FSP39_024753 [Pinctada imbricata]|uniref:Uncharacterized protein n=1 Tax=Pinctada imbricata TaxID=66713 RepID=A0AA88XE51_PINIB|nr:hypothetical protein FSP39_024753 [Pinctada imbricata]
MDRTQENYKVAGASPTIKRPQPVASTDTYATGNLGVPRIILHDIRDETFVLPYSNSDAPMAIPFIAFREAVFQQNHGDRRTAPNFAIILTDGQFQYGSETALAAKQLRDDGVKIFAIGIGDNVSEDGLLKICGDRKYLFHVSSYNLLGTIQQALDTLFCEESCSCSSSQSDVIILLDTKFDTVDDFKQQKSFLFKFMDGLDYGDQKVQIGIAMASSSNDSRVYLNQYHTKSDILAKIIMIRPSTSTNTVIEASYVTFSCAVTDGNPQKVDSFSWTKGGKTIGTNQNYTIFAVRRDDAGVYSCTGTNSAGTSNEATVTLSVLCLSNCKSSYADIAFLLDTSRSESSDDFLHQKQFISNFINSLDVGPHQAQISVVTYSTHAFIHFYLDQYDNKADVLQHIDSMGYIKGSTHTWEALDFLHDYIFVQKNGDRRTAPNIVVILTDGHSQYPYDTYFEAEKLHDEEVKIFAVGIGNDVSENELLNIGGDREHVFHVKSSDLLGDIQKALHTLYCDGTAANPPPIPTTTLPPTTTTVPTTTKTTLREFCRIIFIFVQLTDTFDFD